MFNAYPDVCQQYDFRKGTYKGRTATVEDYFDQLPQQLRIWESGVRAVFVEDNEQEIAIFPRKRTPFLDGTYEDRINAIGTLKLATAGLPSLATVNALITSIYNAILAARLAGKHRKAHWAR